MVPGFEALECIHACMHPPATRTARLEQCRLVRCTIAPPHTRLLGNFTRIGAGCAFQSAAEEPAPPAAAVAPAAVSPAPAAVPAPAVPAPAVADEPESGNAPLLLLQHSGGVTGLQQ
jgi:hypothetical protein